MPWKVSWEFYSWKDYILLLSKVQSIVSTESIETILFPESGGIGTIDLE
jgi:hypothetical protein